MLSSCEMIVNAVMAVNDGSQACKFPFVNCIDQGNARNAMIFWFAMTAAYHIIMSLMSRNSDDSIWQSNWCWKKHCKTMGDSHCRFARFYHCQKRRRKLAADKKNKNDQCPISRLICSMPPPLPFYRRRRPAATVSETVEEPSSEGSVSLVQSWGCATETNEVMVGTTTDTSTQNTEPLTHDQGVQQKKKKRKTSRRMLQPSLIDMARMQRWGLIEQRLHLTTKEAKGRDADGLMPLHWACSGGPPPSVVRALLEAYPKAARRVDSEGSTALHFAAHYGASPMVVASLLEAYPPAICMQDKYGRTPLYHAATKDAGIEVLRTLVQADRGMALTPCVPPSHIGNDATRTQGLQRPRYQDRTPLYSIWTAALSQLRTRHSQGRVLEKAVLLLEAAFQWHVSQNTRTGTSRTDALLSRLIQADSGPTEQRAFRLVHAAVTLDAYLPNKLLPILLERYPEQVRHTDEDGRLPLAIAASLTQVTPERSETIIKLLLEAYPQAASAVDREGQSPLMIALATGKSWESGVELLFRVAPGLINSRDHSSGLYPALLAASAENHLDAAENQNPLIERSTSEIKPATTGKALEWRSRLLSSKPSRLMDSPSAEIGPATRQVSTIFELLQADPGVVRCAVG